MSRSRIAFAVTAAALIAAAVLGVLALTRSPTSPEAAARRQWVSPHGSPTQRARQRIDVAQQIAHGTVLKPGTSQTAVIGLLGKPDAVTQLGAGKEALSYDAGTVPTPEQADGYHDYNVCTTTLVLQLRDARVYGKSKLVGFCVLSGTP